MVCTIEQVTSELLYGFLVTCNKCYKELVVSKVKAVLRQVRPWPYHFVEHQLLVLQKESVESKKKMKCVFPHSQSDVTPSVLLRKCYGHDGVS